MTSSKAGRRKQRLTLRLKEFQIRGSRAFVSPKCPMQSPKRVEGLAEIIRWVEETVESRSCMTMSLSLHKTAGEWPQKIFSSLLWTLACSPQILSSCRAQRNNSNLKSGVQYSTSKATGHSWYPKGELNLDRLNSKHLESQKTRRAEDSLPTTRKKDTP